MIEGFIALTHSLLILAKRQVAVEKISQNRTKSKLYSHLVRLTYLSTLDVGENP